MYDLNQPLSDTELDLLDDFLLDRVPEGIAGPESDEGILDVSELDGFFTAILCGPVLIPPSQWLPVVWGEFEPEWKNEEEFRQILNLMLRHMNTIAGMLMEAPDYYEPLFMERVVKGKLYMIVDEWCYGFMSGVSLAGTAWDVGGEEMETLLEPIARFVDEAYWDELDDLPDEEIEKLQLCIKPSVRKIHAWWLTRRENPMPKAAPRTYDVPQAGRNDPCPCGSGKKYKKCCLH
jgi:uncharacterized protein